MGRWLETLQEFTSVDAIRKAALARTPSLAPSRLTRLAILGAGAEGQRLSGLCVEHGIRVVGVYDGNAAKRGMRIAGCRVMPSDALGSLDRSVPVIIASHRVLGGMDLLRGLGLTAAPFAWLQVMAPDLFPPHMFYERLLEDLFECRTGYLDLAAALADDESRRVLDAVIGFRLTLDPAELRSVIDWDLYGGAGIIRFGPAEVYVDGGSYDGDSVRMFIDHTRGAFEQVLAFEPDPATFRRLVENFRHEPRVRPFNAGLHRRKAVLRFENDGTRAATFTASGGTEVSVVGLDEVLAGNRVSFIKMNIEGSELDALAGAEQSIRAWKPALAVSVYHRASDLRAIPELVRRLNADYRLYLRQHDGGTVETVLYACMEVANGSRDARSGR
jgi:FkbM family methyltransferase